MCELFGFSSSQKKDLTPYLVEFYSHCHYHPNGWGLADFDSADARIYKEPIIACDSKILSELLHEGISSSTLFAHIRYATEGAVKPENCHPFVGTDCRGEKWTLIHNGTIFDGLELVRYRSTQSGDTDSERILLYLIDQIDSEIHRLNRSLTPSERCTIVEDMVDRLSFRNKLNLMIFDGERIYAHYNMKNTLYFKEEEGGVIIATTPLCRGLWKPMPLTTLSVFERGNLVYQGENHQNEYIDVAGTEPHRYDYFI